MKFPNKILSFVGTLYLVGNLFLIHGYSQTKHFSQKKLFLGKCGTPKLLLQQSNESRHGSHSISLKANKAFATPPPSRTYQSEHFVFHYSLDTTTHAPTLIGSEQNLPGQADSIRTASGSSLQSAYDVMDQNNFPHPQYVLKNAEYFEKAWSYYIDTLQMREPVITTPSHYFKKGAVSGKYPVEIVHIAIAEPDVGEEQVYGLAYPPNPSPNGGGILMENDFRYGSARQDLTIQYNGVSPSIHTNYATEWEQALQVTAAHEFYHAVQYAYTPNLQGFHYWYELSASGMEEQLAPNVNDYLQYLPSVFQTHSTYSLNNSSYNDVQTYGNGIFHQFLTQDINRSFDVEVWDFLRSGYSIDSALQAMLSNHNKTIQDVYSRYTRSLPFTQANASSLLPGFSVDHNLWPRITPIFFLEDLVQFSLPTLTYEILDLSNMTPSKNLIFSATESDGTVLTVLYPDSISTHTLPKNTSFALSMTPTPQKLVLANGSWSQKASIVIFRTNIEAYPNPVPQNTSTVHFADFVPEKAAPAGTITIFNEQGDSTYSSELTDSQDSWNLQDKNGTKVPSGVYYYSITGQPTKMLYIQ